MRSSCADLADQSLREGVVEILARSFKRSLHEDLADAMS